MAIRPPKGTEVPPNKATEKSSIEDDLLLLDELIRSETEKFKQKEGIVSTDVLPQEVEPEDRFRALNPWLDSDDHKWIDELYEKVYPLSKSKRHKYTFRNIILNLSLSIRKINITLDKKGYKDATSLSPEFLPSGVSEICNHLSKKGYISLKKGYKVDTVGVSSTIEPTEELLDIFPDDISYRQHPNALVKSGCKGRYPMHVLRAFGVLDRYNKTVEPENWLYAKYKDSYTKDGRFTGSDVILMPKQDRKRIKIDGKPTCEIDVSNCLPFLLQIRATKTKLSGDAYNIKGMPRELVKKAFLVMINTESREQARNAIQSEINLKYPGQYRAPTLITQIEVKHPDLMGFFYRSNGRILMHVEARCMCKFIEKMLDLGIKVYPIYDSVVVAKSNKTVAIDELRKAFTVHGVEPEIHVE